MAIGISMVLLWGCSAGSQTGDSRDARAVVTLTRSTSLTAGGREAPASSATIPIAVAMRPSAQYLDRLLTAVDRTRAQLPQITASADVAADRLARGARLFVGGTQAEFANEMIDRAGGLASVATIPKVLNRGDIVLYAVNSRLTVADRARISRWRSQGVYVIAFASATLSADPYFQPDTLIDSGDDEGLALADGTICPTDAIANLIAAWTWTGEFVAACSRLGRVPVLNQGLGESGALQRAERFRGRVFHDQSEGVRVPPLTGQLLGSAYLDCVAESLEAVKTQAPGALAYAGAWLRHSATPSRGLYAASTLFPEHFADPRAPQLFGTVSDLKLRQPPQTLVSVVIGYQEPPQIAIDYAILRRGKLIYTSARRDAADSRHEIVYVNPHWPADDACVSLPGYDITILPSGSVMQAAVYWSLIAETVGTPPRRSSE